MSVVSGLSSRQVALGITAENFAAISALSVATLAALDSGDKYEPGYLQAISDHSRGTGSTPSSNYMTVEQARVYSDKLGEQAAEFGRYLRATGQQNADGYNYGGAPPSAAEAANDQQVSIGRVTAAITLLNDSKNLMSQDTLDDLAAMGGPARVELYIRQMNGIFATAKNSIQSTTAFATAHQGLAGQMVTQDSNGAYRLGAFALTTQGSGFTMRTGSNGITQIDQGTGVFTTYDNPPVNTQMLSSLYRAIATLPLNITA